MYRPATHAQDQQAAIRSGPQDISIILYNTGTRTGNLIHLSKYETGVLHNFFLILHLASFLPSIFLSSLRISLRVSLLSRLRLASLPLSLAATLLCPRPPTQPPLSPRPMVLLSLGEGKFITSAKSELVPSF